MPFLRGLTPTPGRRDLSAGTRAQGSGELERGGDHEQPTADATGAPEDVARGDRLRRFAEAHVIGKEQPPARERLDATALLWLIEGGSLMTMEAA